ncbi:hypothetical protein BDR05DRAFT_956878 [Suillus weaverae]|nr:hypothetical protein BDR05DRAFT_956878 [Suillus weaverae]
MEGVVYVPIKHHLPSTHRVHHDWLASAWNELKSITAASKHGVYPARAAQPTPVAISSTTGIFVLVFLINDLLWLGI